MTEQLCAPAPAKLNLFLHITNQRDDGYHELQTLFQLLDFGDELTFTPTSDNQITLSDNLTDVTAENNLVFKAAKLLQNHCQITQGVAIALTKHLPAGGGLGGGSSDAATTLLALNKLWQCNLPLTELARLGLQLGADIPVFIHGQTAWAEGVGEVLTPVETATSWYLVIHPQIMVSTGAVFGHKNLTRNSQAITLAAFLRGQVRNDCEPVVRQAYPEVESALNWLSEYSKPRLTGTGACIFAEFFDHNSAQAVLAKIPAPWQGFIAQGTNKSVAHEALGY